MLRRPTRRCLLFPRQADVPLPGLRPRPGGPAVTSETLRKLTEWLENFRQDRRDAHGIGPQKRLDSYGEGYDDALVAVIELLQRDPIS